MKQKFISPVRISINGKFWGMSESVEIYQSEPSSENDMWSGTCIDITKTKIDEKMNNSVKGGPTYDTFFQDAINISKK